MNVGNWTGAIPIRRSGSNVRAGSDADGEAMRALAGSGWEGPVSNAKLRLCALRVGSGLWCFRLSGPYPVKGVVAKWEYS